MFGNSVLKEILEFLKTMNKNYMVSHNSKVEYWDKKSNQILTKVNDIDSKLETIDTNLNILAVHGSIRHIERELEEINNNLKKREGFSSKDSIELRQMNDTLRSELFDIKDVLNTINNKDI